MRTLIILLLSFLISGLSLAGVRIEHWTAPSGAKVYFVETRVVPILDVQIDFAGGGAFVPAAKSGLAGLTRSLLEAGAGDMDEERIAVAVGGDGEGAGGGRCACEGWEVRCACLWAYSSLFCNSGPSLGGRRQRRCRAHCHDRAGAWGGRGRSAARDGGADV